MLQNIFFSLFTFMFLGIIGISSADEQCSEARFKCIKRATAFQ